jgi:hypothetical protein
MTETRADHALLIDRAERRWLDDARDRLLRTTRHDHDDEPDREAER